MFELHEQMLYDMNQRLNCYTIECKLKLQSYSFIIRWLSLCNSNYKQPAIKANWWNIFIGPLGLILFTDSLIEYVVPENLKGCKDVLEILKLYQPYDDIPIFKAETNVKDLIV